MQIFGIPTCGSVRKAVQWAKEKHVPYTFHNFRTRGLSEELLSTFLKQVSGDVLLNRKGLAWRNLSQEEKRKANTPKGLRTLLLENPTLIKRPVVIRQDGSVIVGVEPEKWGE